MRYVNYLNFLTILWLVLFLSACTGTSNAPALRVAVIGGLDMSGVWPELEAAAEQALNFPVETVLAAPKERVVPAFREGRADVLLIHGGDESFALEALGYAAALRTWAYNEFVIAGPAGDPAGLAAVTSGRDAMLRLQQTGAPLISFRDVASQQIIRRLLDSAGLFPRDINLIPDAAGRAQEILQQAAREQAYVIVGHMPVAFDRMPASGIRILVSGDPAMRRGYVALAPGPRHPASDRVRTQATQLVDFLISERGQGALIAIGEEDGPWLLPRNAGEALIDFEQSTGQRRQRR